MSELTARLDANVRLATLAGYDILDTPAEIGFDDLVSVAAQLCGTPTALVSLLDRDRQWFKARVGCAETETPMSQSVCRHALHGDGLLVIPDLTEDERTRRNTLVTDGPHIRFYAGAVLQSPTGVRLGTLCVIDTVARLDGLTPEQARCLQALARQVMSQLELRRSLKHRDKALSALRAAQAAAVAAKNEAEEANRAKSLFLTNMSHELRTPLSAVIGYSEMLEEEASDLNLPSFVADLRRINANASHLLSMINNLLDLSKIEAGKMDVVREVADAAELLRGVESTVGALVGKKNNVLRLQLDDDLGSLDTDVTKIRQCLFNLVGNAAKFTENGTVVLSASRDRVDGLLTIRVSDTGIGMTAEQTARIFERFTQAEETTSNRFGGTGLGLAITKAFCALLGGDVVVESRMGEGTTFTMRVPATLGTHAGT